MSFGACGFQFFWNFDDLLTEMGHFSTLLKLEEVEVSFIIPRTTVVVTVPQLPANLNLRGQVEHSDFKHAVNQLVHL
jgi:hypothetical protein